MRLGVKGTSKRVLKRCYTIDRSVSFCNNVFRDCLNYAMENTKASFPSIVSLNFLHHERFKAAEQREALTAESREESKSPVVVFAVRNSTKQRPD